jgi:hypothetical protein
VRVFRGNKQRCSKEVTKSNFIKVVHAKADVVDEIWGTDKLECRVNEIRAEKQAEQEELARQQAEEKFRAEVNKQAGDRSTQQAHGTNQGGHYNFTPQQLAKSIGNMANSVENVANGLGNLQNSVENVAINVATDVHACDGGDVNISRPWTGHSEQRNVQALPGNHR